MKDDCPHRPGQGKEPAAFSLTELLICIGLLSVLMLLGLPLHRELKNKTNAAECIANLRQYGTAVLAYVSDHGRLAILPPSASSSSLNWHTLLVPQYLAHGLKCPTARGSDRAATYAANTALSEYFPTLKGIPAPDSRIVLAAERDYPTGFRSPTHFNMTIWGASESQVKADPEGNDGRARPSQYHGTPKERGLHFFFLDGHMARVVPVGNDFSQAPVLGDATNGGYFYAENQFNRMSRGVLRVP